MSRVAATSSYAVDFRPERAPEPEPVGRVLRVAKLVALAHRIDGMIRAGEIPDLATAARLCGVTRARMTQIMNLLLLAPEIQEAILDLPTINQGRDPVTERNLRPIVANADWKEQVRLWHTVPGRDGSGRPVRRF